MATATFGQFQNDLKAALLKYATDSWNAYRNQAVGDGQAFIDQMKQDLQTWTGQLVAKQITAADFRFNVQSQKALAQLIALKQSGLAKVDLDKFTSGLVDVIVNTATSTFLGA